MKIPVTRYRYKSGIFDETDMPKRIGLATDGRDMIINKQERRIEELEARVKELERMMKEGNNANN